MTLTETHLEALEELVGPAAWAFHASLPPELRVNLPRAFRVRGTVQAVAAAVLRAAAQGAARADAEGSAGQTRRLRDGAEELEYFQARSAAASDAATWLTAAQALERNEARVTANPIPELSSWGTT